MSDNENDDYSVSVGGDSDGENEDYVKPNFVKNKKINAKPTITDYEEDDEDDEYNEVNKDDDEIEDENKNIELPDNDEDTEIEDDDDDEEEDEDDDDDDLYGDVEDDDGDDDDKNGDDDDDDDENEKPNSSNKLGGAKTGKNKSKQEKKQNNIQLDVGNNDDYEDDDDYQDENYLQKFDKEMTRDYILDFHPECLNNNYDEIKSLSNVTRDEFNIIIDPLHKTIPFLTKYEKARILGQRAKQIECGAKPLVKVPENIIDSYIIAELELEQKMIPFIIRRPIPSGGSEYWNLKDLEMISF